MVLFINSYENDALKRKALLSMIQSAKSEARETAMAFDEQYDTDEMIEKKAKAQFFNLSQADRKHINERVGVKTSREKILMIQSLIWNCCS